MRPVLIGLMRREFCKLSTSPDSEHQMRPMLTELVWREVYKPHSHQTLSTELTSVRRVPS